MQHCEKVAKSRGQQRTDVLSVSNIVESEVKMEKKICPLMSRLVVIENAHGFDALEMHFADCGENNCQLWSSVYTTENTLISGCSIEIAAHKTQDGKYAV